MTNQWTQKPVALITPDKLYPLSAGLFAHFGLSHTQHHAPENTDIKALFDDLACGAYIINGRMRRQAGNLCNALTDRARMLGLVDTVIRRDDGCLCGDVVAVDAVKYAVAALKHSFSPKAVALIVGAGMTADCAAAALTDSGFTVRRYADGFTPTITDFNSVELILTVEVDTGNLEKHIGAFSRRPAVIDLTLNPLHSSLIQAARNAGYPVQNGIGILAAHTQSVVEYLSGQTFSSFVLPALIRDAQQHLENIVLIGMPGVGKSTLGPLIARRLRREFVDTDKIVENMAGMSVRRLILQGGEPALRAMETQAVASIAERQGLVIATGGGTVCQAQNHALLKRNGRCIWLRRPLDELSILRRPLSRRRGVHTLYSEREALYRTLADKIVDMDTPENTLAQILGEK